MNFNGVGRRAQGGMGRVFAIEQVGTAVID